MERKLQYVFISILVLLLLFSVIANLILDNKAKRMITDKIYKIMELSKDKTKLNNYINIPIRKEILSKENLNSLTKGFSKEVFSSDVVSAVMPKVSKWRSLWIQKNLQNKRIKFFKLEKRLAAIVDLTVDEDEFSFLFWNAKQSDGKAEGPAEGAQQGEREIWIPVLIFNKKVSYDTKIEAPKRVVRIEERRREALKKKK